MVISLSMAVRISATSLGPEAEEGVGEVDLGAEDDQLVTERRHSDELTTVRIPVTSLGSHAEDGKERSASGVADDEIAAAT